MTVRIRAAGSAYAGSIARVHVDVWRTAYVGIVSDRYLADLSYQSSETWWADILATPQTAACTFVAETGEGEVVGFARGGLESEGDLTYKGELYTVYLLKDHQRKGVGRSLVSAVARSLLASRIDSMLVWTFEENSPACRFYESLGGRLVGRKTVEIGGEEIVEVSYGWKDIAALATVSVD